MAKELNEETGFKVSVKTLIGIAVGITTVVGFWFAFQGDLQVMRSDIEDAKKLPDPVIDRIEYDLKDQLVRQTIMDTQDDVDEIKDDMDRIEAKIDKL
jgi:hypothetical protein|tara:strand:+ start:1099 stop:1392 length:294 start_codon:yes stop_codon:yes gene_type:complete